MNALCVAPDRVHDVWPHVVNMLKPAMECGLSDFATVEHDVRNGGALLWLAWDGREIYAAAVTTLNISNGRKFMTIVACGGHEMWRWLFLLGALEKNARDEGCKSVAIYGRKGWARKLDGYKMQSVVLEKELI